MYYLYQKPTQNKKKAIHNYKQLLYLIVVSSNISHENWLKSVQKRKPVFPKYANVLLTLPRDNY